MRTRLLASVIGLCLPLLLTSLVHAPAAARPASPPSTTDKDGWKKLFDGKSLAGWKRADFGDEGKVHVKDGVVVMEKGKLMSGITYSKGDFPKMDYEVTLEAKRLSGKDFFCTTTFPVGDSFCSLVVGGWGGTVVGLSNIDFMDASMNETNKYKEFKNDQWYRVRIRVTKKKIEAWIDKEKLIDLDTTDKHIAIRIECSPSRPFGISTWNTAGAVRDIRIRAVGAGSEGLLAVTLRSRAKEAGKTIYTTVEKKAAWDPKKTAIIVCDMWDTHWCKSAADRVVELASPMNGMLAAARKRGVFIIHAPSTCTSFYKDTPQRKCALGAPFAATPVPLEKTQRWGTAWYWTDGKREGVLPIDDSDMGCDCKVKCEIGSPWKRQLAAIKMEDADALTDNGQEVWNLLTEKGIDNVILCGVHLNMCVLGRPFAIRQLVKLGKNVALMRDMTDTMYNPDRPPGISHFAGTDRMVEHVEKFWCPSLSSSDITGKAPFRFQGDRREK
jgi:nicotinamidase-related amidase